jgi:hypothetical protein
LQHTLNSLKDNNMTTHGEIEIERDNGKGGESWHSLQVEAHWIWVEGENGTLQTGRGFVLDYVDAVDDMGKEFDLTSDEEEEASRSIYPEGGAE